MNEYRNIVRTISPLVGNAGVSIEVFAEENTTAEEMFDQGQEMFTWIPNNFIKYPCTSEGLHAAEQSVSSGIRVNMTLCFSQAQAAAVYTATKGAKVPVYVSPFVGRLDDIGENGMDLVKNMKQMYATGDGHVAVLAASIRNLEQLLYCFYLETELVTYRRRYWKIGLIRAARCQTPASSTKQRESRSYIKCSTSSYHGKGSTFSMSSHVRDSNSLQPTITQLCLKPSKRYKSPLGRLSLSYHSTFC